MTTIYIARRATHSDPAIDNDNYFDKWIGRKNQHILPDIFVDFCLRNIRLYIDRFNCESPIPHSFKMFELFVAQNYPDVTLESIFKSDMACLDSEQGNVISFLYSIVYYLEIPDPFDDTSNFMDNFIIDSCLTKIKELISKMNVPVESGVLEMVQLSDRLVNETDVAICPELHAALVQIATASAN